MTGDQADIMGRLKRLLPPWFDQVASTPVLDAVLSGAASVLAGVYSLYAYAQLQTRIATATDGFLDLIALDFFGSNISRRANQSDASFRSVIQANLFPQRNTRQAITQVLERLTGNTPIIIEPWNTGDTGVLDGQGFYWDADGCWAASMTELPYQGFVTAFRPLSPANSNLSGWDVPTGAWDAGYFYWADEYSGSVTDPDIIAAVESVRMANTRIWLSISDDVIFQIVSGPELDFSNPDNSALLGGL